MARHECRCGVLVLTLVAFGCASWCIPGVAQRRTDPLSAVKADIRVKNFAGANAQLQLLAAGGNVEAEYLLGVFYLSGLNGLRDPVQAKSWLEKSASHGNTRAAHTLAAFTAASDEAGPELVRSTEPHVRSEVRDELVGVEGVDVGEGPG